MNENREFWNKRARRYGHTGWTDNLIYVYDQQARLLAIEKILSTLTCHKSVALDFGCGSGDFSNLLAKYFEKVIAFDISDKVVEIAKGRYGKIKNIQFHCDSYIKNIEIPEDSIDLILSVTVLDHIMDDSELLGTLAYFKKILKNDGFLIALESAYDYSKPKSFYKKFTEFKQWLAIFSQCGFSLNKYYHFCDPLEYPCDSYLSYKRSIGDFKAKVLTLISRWATSKLMDKYLGKLAVKNLQGENDFLWEKEKQPSSTKIMIFKKFAYDGSN